MFVNKELRESLNSFRFVYLKSSYEMYQSSHKTYVPNPSNFSTKTGVKGEIVNYGSGRMSNKIFVESEISKGNKALEKARKKAAVSSENVPDNSPDSSPTNSTAEV